MPDTAGADRATKRTTVIPRPLVALRQNASGLRASCHTLCDTHMFLSREGHYLFG